MIEPAAFGLPVSFGPNTENFREIVQELLNHNAAEVIQDEATLRSFIERQLGDPDSAAEMGMRAKNVVMNHLGASQRTVEVLSAAMEDPFGSAKLEQDVSTRAA